MDCRFRAFQLPSLLIALSLLGCGSAPTGNAFAELPRAAPSAVGFEADKLGAFSSRVRADVAQGKLAGAVVLVARQGRIAHLDSIGVLNPATGKPMTEDAIFRIYSMTKPITIVSALMLVEDGKLKLDDPVALYIPEMGRMKVIGQAAPAARVMTLRDLMRHTAGLDYGFISPQSERTRLLGEMRRKGPPDPSIAEYTRLLAEVPLAAEPGTVWTYSTATDVLGRVVEVASGKPFAAFLAERIFAPLDMRDTGFFFTDADRHGRIAEPAMSDRLLGGGAMFDPRLARRGEFGGDGLVSTARDYARFLQMLVNGGQLDGRRLLRAESVAEMTRDQLGPISRGSTYAPGPAYGFGLGVAVRTAGRGEQPAGETGDYFWGGAAGSYFWVDPKNQMFAILMMQSPAMRAPYRPLMREMVYDAMQR